MDPNTQALLTSAVVATIISGIAALISARYQNHLRAIAFERETRFGKLHEKQAEVIAEIYKLLRNVELASESLTEDTVLDDESVNQDQMKYMIDTGLSLYNYFNDNRLYLPEDLCNKLDEFLRISEVIVDRAQGDIELNHQQKSDLRKQNYKLATRKIPQLKQDTEKEFRKLLGVRLN